MKEYTKPLVEVNSELAEGVYAASGDVWWCDSQYIKGNFHVPTYAWNTTVIEHYGCNGCRAFCGSFCNAAKGNVYEADNGFRKPEWEQKGYLPDRKIDDENPKPF